MNLDTPQGCLSQLADIERQMGELQPSLAYAAEQRVLYADYVKRAKAALLPKAEGATKEAREAVVLNQLSAHGPVANGKLPLLDAAAAAEAAYAKTKHEFDVLDARRSIVQSALKAHLTPDPTALQPQRGME